MTSLPELTRGGDTTIKSAHLHKVLYDGTKSFWRTGENIDVRIIEHIDALVIEVIAFDLEKYEEADRLYIDADKLFKKLETSELLEKVEQKRAEYARMRKRVPLEEITRGLLREVSSQYILSRIIISETRTPKQMTPAEKEKRSAEEAAAKTMLGVVGAGDEVHEDATGDDDAAADAGHDDRVEADTNAAAVTVDSATDENSLAISAPSYADSETSAVGGGSSPKSPKAMSAKELLAEPRFAVAMAVLTGDKTVGPKKLLDVLLSEPPRNIEYVTVTRARKKATKLEFNAALRSLRQDSDKLNKACSDAQRKAGLAVSSVDGFKMAAAKVWDPSQMSRARWLWIWACRRVCLQNYVAAVTRRLIELEEKALEQNEAINEALAKQEEGKGPKLRKKKGDSSLLPSLQSKAGRHSLGTLRRLSRGSREPRQLDDFSSALSSSIRKHADGLKNKGGKPQYYGTVSLDRLPGV